MFHSGVELREFLLHVSVHLAEGWNSETELNLTRGGQVTLQLVQGCCTQVYI